MDSIHAFNLKPPINHAGCPRSSPLELLGIRLGYPMVSDPKALKALEPTTQAFVSFAENKGMRCVYCCVDDKLEEILSSMGWSTVSCINEDVIDPEHCHGFDKRDFRKETHRW
ncbi:hypothetical protein DEU56DRAFT_773648 [Suillus clintonianus]|uniref:uncharacterized protein n=1 Tax=Suillus clintonianus TaxID=1904413 RepID=UPI001B86CEC5|nr:uncharacterized protein DEU56DRAFT_773648 [Suillus clintonianus]KAG2153203.1 hypothetical protein DEU56DRAFT_773648 [Suillus clintonianus]